MDHVRIDDVEVPATNSPVDVVRPFSRALGTTDFAMNYFERVSGASFDYAYHRHNDQEEVFYIQTGTTFETETGETEVGAREAIRFAPGEFQLGRKQSDERVAAPAIGIPRDTEGDSLHRGSVLEPFDRTVRCCPFTFDELR